MEYEFKNYSIGAKKMFLSNFFVNLKREAKGTCNLSSILNLLPLTMKVKCIMSVLLTPAGECMFGEFFLSSQILIVIILLIIGFTTNMPCVKLFYTLSTLLKKYKHLSLKFWNLSIDILKTWLLINI